MGDIVFATGGTTKNSKLFKHDWECYEFSVSKAAISLEEVFNKLSVCNVANCLTAGNLWGGFLFAHEICRILQLNYYPFTSTVDNDELACLIKAYEIDTIFCLPSFADRLITKSRRDNLISLGNLFFLGE